MRCIGFLETLRLLVFSLYAASFHIVFIKDALNYAVRWSIQVSRVVRNVACLDTFRLVLRINFATNHIARLQADCNDDTGANIRATPTFVAAPKLNADMEINVVHVVRICQPVASAVSCLRGYAASWLFGFGRLGR